MHLRKSPAPFDLSASDSPGAMRSPISRPRTMGRTATAVAASVMAAVVLSTKPFSSLRKASTDR